MMVLESSTCSPQSSQRLARRFAALGDEMTIKMLRALVSAPATCTELAQRVHCCVSMAWQRLEKLVQAGLVEKQGRTKSSRYVAHVEEINAFLDGVAHYFCQNAEKPGLS